MSLPTRSAVFRPDMRRPWLLANFVGFAIGAALWGGVLRGLEQPYYESQISTMDAARIQAISSGVSWAIAGAVIGTAQWLVLRRLLRARWWIPATSVGFALGGIVSGFNAGGSVSTIGPDAGPLPPVVGVVLWPLVIYLVGSGQWLILRREIDGPGWWPAVNGAAIIAGFGAGLGVAKLLPWFAPTDFPSAPALAVVGSVGGPVYGWLTWAFLSSRAPAENRDQTRRP